MYEYRYDERLKTKNEVIHASARTDSQGNTSSPASGRGTGTPKDKDEVNRQEVCECEG